MISRNLSQSGCENSLGSGGIRIKDLPKAHANPAVLAILAAVLKRQFPNSFFGLECEK